MTDVSNSNTGVETSAKKSSGSGMFYACALTFIFTSILTTALSKSESQQEFLKLMSNCSVGQNLAVRETSGAAWFTVTFKDGKPVNYVCNDSGNGQFSSLLTETPRGLGMSIQIHSGSSVASATSKNE